MCRMVRVYQRYQKVFTIVYIINKKIFQVPSIGHINTRKTNDDVEKTEK